MTLKEKLQEEKLYINPHSFKLTKEGAENFVDIFDIYAIGFARFYKMANNNEYHLYPNASIEKHLEIYKKESGL
jgi:hypothetical protein